MLVVWSPSASALPVSHEKGVVQGWDICKASPKVAILSLSFLPPSQSLASQSFPIIGSVCKLATPGWPTPCQAFTSSFCSVQVQSVTSPSPHPPPPATFLLSFSNVSWSFSSAALSSYPYPTTLSLILSLHFLFPDWESLCLSLLSAVWLPVSACCHLPLVLLDLYMFWDNRCG